LIRDYLVQLWDTFIKEHDRDLKVSEWCGWDEAAAKMANCEGYEDKGGLVWNSPTSDPPAWNFFTVVPSQGGYEDACVLAKGFDDQNIFATGSNLAGNASATMTILNNKRNLHEECRVDRYDACTHTTCRHFDAYRGVKDGSGGDDWEWTIRPTIADFSISPKTCPAGSTCTMGWANYRISKVSWLQSNDNDANRKKTMLPRGWWQHSNTWVSDDTLYEVKDPHYLPSCVKDGCGGESCFGATYLQADRVYGGSVRAHVNDDAVSTMARRSVATGVGIVPSENLYDFEKCLRAFDVWLGPGGDCIKSQSDPWGTALITTDNEWLPCIEEATNEDTTEIPGMWPMYQACKQYRKITEDKDAECREKQREFEDAHCKHYQLIGFHVYELDKCMVAEADACGLYDDSAYSGDCETANLAVAQGSTCAGVEKRWRQRQADNETAEHIDCLLAALTSSLESADSGATGTSKDVEQDDITGSEEDYDTAKANKERANAALGFCRGWGPNNGEVWRAKVGTVPVSEAEWTTLYNASGQSRGWTNDVSKQEFDLQLAKVYDYFEIKAGLDAAGVLAVQQKLKSTPYFAMNFEEMLKPKRTHWIIPCGGGKGGGSPRRRSTPLEPPPCTAGDLDHNDVKILGFKSKYYSLIATPTSSLAQGDLAAQTTAAYTAAENRYAKHWSIIQTRQTAWKQPADPRRQLSDSVERWFSAEREEDHVVCEGLRTDAAPESWTWNIATTETFPVREGSFGSSVTAANEGSELKWCKLNSVFPPFDPDGTQTFEQWVGTAYTYPRSPIQDSDAVQDSVSTVDKSWHKGDDDIDPTANFDLGTPVAIHDQSNSYREWKARSCWDVAACDPTTIGTKFSVERFTQAKCHSYYKWHHDLAWKAAKAVTVGSVAAARIAVKDSDSLSDNEKLSNFHLAGSAVALSGNDTSGTVTGAAENADATETYLSEDANHETAFFNTTEQQAVQDDVRSNFDSAEDMTDEETAADAASK